MPVNDESIRRAATQQFMTEGLGGQLTRNARIMIDVANTDRIGSNRRIAAGLACGNILERILWAGLGQWLGYLQNPLPISPEERTFLTEKAEAFNEAEWPRVFGHVMRLLKDREIETGASFFDDQIVGSALPKNARQMFPLFQASHIVAECLNEGPITSFFTFLRDGDIEDFVSRTPSPDTVMECFEDEDSLLQEENPGFDFYSFGQPEFVIAGFIRYTEFLSAMDSLFPGLEEKEAREVPSRIINRALLADEVKEIIAWRFPTTDKTLAAYTAVRHAFLKLVSQQFERYPESGLRWHEIGASVKLERLSYRFFGIQEVYEISDSAFEGAEGSNVQIPGTPAEQQSRIVAANLERLREIKRSREASGLKFSVQDDLTAGEE